MRAALPLVCRLMLLVLAAPVARTAATEPLAQAAGLELTGAMVDDLAAYAAFVRGADLTAGEREQLRSAMVSSFAADGDFIIELARDARGALEKVAAQGEDAFAMAELRERFVQALHTPPPVVPDVWHTVVNLVEAKNPVLARSGLKLLTRRGADSYIDFFNYTAGRLGQEQVTPDQREEAIREIAAAFARATTNDDIMAAGESRWIAFQAALNLPKGRRSIEEAIDLALDAQTDAFTTVFSLNISGRGYFLNHRARIAEQTTLHEAAGWRLTQAMFDDMLVFCEFLAGRYFAREDIARLRDYAIAAFDAAPEEEAKSYEQIRGTLEAIGNSVSRHALTKLRETLLRQLMAQHEKNDAVRLIETYLAVRAQSGEAALTDEDLSAQLAADLLVSFTIGQTPTDANQRQAARERILASFQSMSSEDRERLAQAPQRLLALADALAQPAVVANVRAMAQAKIEAPQDVPAFARALEDEAVTAADRQQAKDEQLAKFMYLSVIGPLLPHLLITKGP